ncbi:MAG: uL15 family ribosomal protein [Methanophagales archaeon]|nr:uL15 family ribosomal protein [Methanophagales archaeon]MCW3141105.1 uL15 family ribosomal protein [Methanophagales archaeon]
MKKRIKRIRGTRTCGGGSHKKRRGKGSKGGSGNAGAYGHHFVWSLKKGIRKGKNKLQLPLRTRSAEKTVNIGELEAMLGELIEKGKAEEKADGTGVYLDATQLGIQKILGKGRVTKKLILKANKISRVAKEKIESAGGEVKIEVEAASGV